MASNAFSGVGTQFKRGSMVDSSGATYTAIAEINSISGPNITRSTIDVTSLDSTNGYREFISGFRDGGEVTLEMNFTRDGYLDMKTDMDSDDAVTYQIVLSDTGATTFEFEAYATNVGMAVPTDDKVTASVSLKIDGEITITS